MTLARRMTPMIMPLRAATALHRYFRITLDSRLDPISAEHRLRPPWTGLSASSAERMACPHNSWKRRVRAAGLLTPELWWRLLRHKRAQRRSLR